MADGIMRLGPRADQVFLDLRQRIDDGELPPHARLPSERDLCRQFDVNRGTLRQALARLEAEGRIATRRGSGSHVLAARPQAARTNIISIMCGGEMPELSGITRQALEAGCTLGLYSQDQMKWDLELEALFLRRVKQQRHLGLLAACSPRGDENQRLLAEMAADGTRIVHTEPYSLGDPVQDFLLPDYERAGYAAAVHLLMAGYRRLVCVTMPNSGPGIQLAERGFRAALRDQGIGPAARISLDDDPAHGTIHYMSPAYLPDQSRAAWSRFFAALDGPTGLVIPGVGRAAETWAMVKASGRTDIRIVYTDTGPHYHPVVTPELDCFRFDRAALYRRAIDHITSDAPAPLRHRLPPRLQTTG